MGFLKDWIGVIVAVVNLLLMLWGILKVLQKQEYEWSAKENRLLTVENEVKMLHLAVSAFTVAQTAMSGQLTAVTTRLDDLIVESKRTQARLDQYLDRKGT